MVRTYAHLRESPKAGTSCKAVLCSQRTLREGPWYVIRYAITLVERDHTLFGGEIESGVRKRRTDDLGSGSRER